MIERTYFIHAKLNHLDGKQSYSWHYFHISLKSWKEDSERVFNDAMDELRKTTERKGLPAKGIEVTCFCRC